MSRTDDFAEEAVVKIARLEGRVKVLERAGDQAICVHNVLTALFNRGEIRHWGLQVVNKKLGEYLSDADIKADAAIYATEEHPVEQLDAAVDRLAQLEAVAEAAVELKHAHDAQVAAGISDENFPDALIAAETVTLTQLDNLWDRLRAAGYLKEEKT